MVAWVSQPLIQAGKLLPMPREQKQDFYTDSIKKTEKIERVLNSTVSDPCQPLVLVPKKPNAHIVSPQKHVCGLLVSRWFSCSYLKECRAQNITLGGAFCEVLISVLGTLPNHTCMCRLLRKPCMK